MQDMTTTDSKAVHRCDHRFGNVANDVMQGFDIHFMSSRTGVVPPTATLTLITTSAEGFVTCSSKNHHADRMIPPGVFEGCNPPAGRPSQTVQDVLKDRLGDLGLPVIYGLSFGHIRDQFTLPVGIEAELDTEKATLTLLETGVV